MAVGTGAISLQEVVDEIAGVQTSLQDCVDDYTGTLDPTYGTAPVTSLAEFRGYADVTSYSHTLDSDGFKTDTLACAETADTTYYSDDALIGFGSTIYTDSGLTTVFNGGGLFYKGTISTSFQINSSGVITLVAICT